MVARFRDAGENLGTLRETKGSSAQIALQSERRWRRRVKQLPLCDGTWCYSRRGQKSDPVQGWKIHIPATRLSANSVFARVLPILSKHKALFKVPAKLEFLAYLNAGIGQFSQVGKFLTVYPASARDFGRLAQELHLATRGFRGPEVPFDVRYSKESSVYYRYGLFSRSTGRSDASGTIIDAKGKRHADRRTAGAAIPKWLKDPLAKSRINSHRPPEKGPIGTDFLAFKVITQRGKGGVYVAVDLSASPARLVIIKEGRRHGETAWDNEDGYARVKHEARVLRALRKAGVPAPQVHREFTQDGSRYLVLEKIPGRPLLPRNRAQPGKASWRRAQTFLRQLSPILSRLHAAGWVWRDCKPSHIFLQRGNVRLIDFEGACPIRRTNALPWGSPNYSPGICQKTFRRRPGVFEDHYALGVIAFQLGTGKFPSLEPRKRDLLYRRTHCPVALRSQIEILLTGR